MTRFVIFVTIWTKQGKVGLFLHGDAGVYTGNSEGLWVESPGGLSCHIWYLDQTDSEARLPWDG
jgi:hypothetical protein